MPFVFPSLPTRNIVSLKLLSLFKESNYSNTSLKAVSSVSLNLPLRDLLATGREKMGGRAQHVHCCTTDKHPKTVFQDISCACEPWGYHKSSVYSQQSRYCEIWRAECGFEQDKLHTSSAFPRTWKQFCCCCWSWGALSQRRLTAKP